VKIRLQTSLIALVVITLATAALIGKQVLDSTIRHRLMDDVKQNQGIVAGALALNLAESIRARSQQIQLLGQTLTPYVVAEASDKITRELEQVKAGYPYFSWIGFANATGKVVAATDGLLVDTDVSARPWFSASQRESHIGDVHEALLLAGYLPENSDGSPPRFIDYATPVLDAEGNLLGIVAAHIAFNWVSDIFNQLLNTSKYDATELFVLGGSGEVHYRSNLTRSLSALEDESTISTKVPIFGEGGAPLDWAVVVIDPLEEIEAQIRTVGGNLMASLLPALFVSILVGMWFSRQIKLAILGVAHFGEQRFRMRGEDSVLRPVSRIVEIDQLADTIDIAATQLDQSTDLLLQANRNLETNVAERTSELAKGLDDAIELRKKGARVYAAVAHELRTPIAALNMLARDEENLEQQRTQFIQMTDQLIDTLDDMRIAINPSLSRPLTPSDINLRLFVDHVTALVKPVAKSTGIAMEVVVDNEVMEDSVWVNLDEYRLKVATTNLIKNACLHSEGRNVRFGVSIEDSNIEISVSDDGVGIPSDAVEELYKPFSRGETKADGTGMGLFITRSMVEEIGGQLTYNRLAPGSRFTILLPRTMPQTKSLQREQNEEGVGVEKSAVHVINAAVRACLCDDDRLTRMLHKNLLSKHLAEVVVYDKASDAVDQLDGFDLLLTDMYMPDINGDELVVHVRESGYEGVIVVVSGMEDDEQVARLKRLGANEVISKPLTGEKIVGILDRYFSTKPIL